MKLEIELAAQSKMSIINVVKVRSCLAQLKLDFLPTKTDYNIESKRKENRVYTSYKSLQYIPEFIVHESSLGKLNFYLMGTKNMKTDDD